MRHLILSLFLILSSLSAVAQQVNNTTQLVGSWIGKLSFGSRELNIGLNIEQQEGYVVCSLDSPDQGVKGIGCYKNFLTDDAIKVTVSAIGATYEAELVVGNLVGTFSQGGLSLPLTLKRGEYYQKAARQGHTDALYNLGYCHLNGMGTEENIEMAAQCFKKAAQNGDAESQYITAMLCENGIGCDSDIDEATHWYTQAAEQGHEEATLWLSEHNNNKNTL